MADVFLTRTVAPTAYPVTLEEVKASARIDGDEEDAILTAYIAAAVRSVEEMSGLALMPQTWAYSFDGPSGQDRICLPKTPVASIGSISYQDADDTTQTDTVGNYYLFKDDYKAMVEPKDAFNWPTTFDRPDAITITFVAGFPDASSVPETLRHAVILLATHWFEHRMPVSTEKAMPIPFAVDHLVNLDRVGWFAA